MARYVKLTVVYDMDDPEKPLGQELRDWLEGAIALCDVDSSEYELREISEDEARKWFGGKP